jgi:hypothetical protein
MQLRQTETRKTSYYGCCFFFCLPFLFLLFNNENLRGTQARFCACKRKSNNLFLTKYFGSFLGPPSKTYGSIYLDTLYVNDLKTRAQEIVAPAKNTFLSLKYIREILLGSKIFVGHTVA